MRKALFLSHVPPFPEVGGDRLRIAQSLRLLAELCHVDVAFISHDRKEWSLKPYVHNIGKEYCFYASRARRYGRALRTVFNRRPEVVNHFLDRRLRCFVESVADDYDFVFCASPVMAQYAFKAKFKGKVLDMTDSMTMNNRQAALVARGLGRLWYESESRRMRRYEARCAGEFDNVAYISELDMDYLPGGSKCVVGNAVAAVDSADCCRYTPTSFNIVFVGKMNYEPNVRAAVFFATEVFPQVRDIVPQSRFYIVGSNPLPEIKTLAGIEGVEVTGFVPSVHPYYADAAVVVAPMLSGSGIQNKILEALAHGCCVLTSPKGFEGIERLDDVLTVVGPYAGKWVDATAALLTDRAKARALGEAAAVRVMEEFGKDKIREEFRNFLSPVL